MIWEQKVNWKENAKVVDNNFIGGFEELKEHLKK